MVYESLCDDNQKYLFLTSTTREGCFSHPVDPSQTFTVQSIWMSCRAWYLLLPPSAPKPEVLIPGDVRRRRSNLSSGQKNQQLIKKGTKRKEIYHIYIYTCVGWVRRSATKLCKSNPVNYSVLKSHTWNQEHSEDSSSTWLTSRTTMTG